MRLLHGNGNRFLTSKLLPLFVRKFRCVRYVKIRRDWWRRHQMGNEYMLLVDCLVKVTQLIQLLRWPLLIQSLPSNTKWHKLINNNHQPRESTKQGNHNLAASTKSALSASFRQKIFIHSQITQKVNATLDVFCKII